MGRMDDDDLLTVHPEFLRSLILKLRAVMAQEELVSPDSGSNPSDCLLYTSPSPRDS